MRSLHSEAKFTWNASSISRRFAVSWHYVMIRFLTQTIACLSTKRVCSLHTAARLALGASAAIAAGALQACAAPSEAAAPVHRQGLVVDDAVVGVGQNHFEYSGKWEHVRRHYDGRLDGTSSRSVAIGDSSVLIFSGSAVRLYGVRGPNGGLATVAIDGQYLGTIDFHAGHKQVTQVFSSPALAPGSHALALLVAGSRTEHTHAYVNIDYARVSP